MGVGGPFGRGMAKPRQNAGRSPLRGFQRCYAAIEAFGFIAHGVRIYAEAGHQGRKIGRLRENGVVPD